MRFHASDRRGVVLVWVAALLVLFVTLIGVGIDSAYVLVTKQQLSNAADAAALAAVAQVHGDLNEVRAEAYNVALANSAAKAPVELDLNEENDPAGDIVIGQYDEAARTFTPTLEDPNAVKVVARRSSSAPGGPLPLLFGPAFGADSASVTASSIAAIGGGTGAGLVVLNRTDERSLYAHGTVDLNVVGGAIHINSSHSNGGYFWGANLVNAPRINVKGMDPGVAIGGNSVYGGEIYTDKPPLRDPLRLLPAPPVGSPMTPSGITASGVYAPGYYPDGIDLGGGDVVVLQAGIYVLGGDGLNVSAGANLSGLETMFYILSPAGINVSGSGDVLITPPTSGTYNGVSIFQARDNTSLGYVSGTGFATGELFAAGVGAVYLPNAKLEIRGTGSGLNFHQLIADKLEIHGTGEVTIRFFGHIPAAANFVYLVE